MKTCLPIVLLLLLSASESWHQVADARPLYAARTGRACATCHVDPAGGGMRTGTGFQYARNGHSLVPIDEPESELDPRISEGFRLGGDLRAQYMLDAHNEVRARSTFFLMQSSLYLSAEINDRTAIVYANDSGRTLEAFALVGGFPMNATLKIGKFRPAYGLEVEDHTTFTRDGLGLGNGSEQTGLELSVVGSGNALNLGVVNGLSGPATLDDNAQKAVIGRLWHYEDRYGMGVSGLLDSPGSSSLALKRLYNYGAFGFLHSDRFVLLAEYDRGGREADDGKTVEIEAVFGELSYLLTPRFTLKARYDRLDQDLDLAENALDRVALGLEADVYPLTRVLTFVRGLREYGTDTEGNFPSYGDTRDTLELIAQLHVSF